jgi:hypothetical protein
MKMTGSRTKCVAVVLIIVVGLMLPCTTTAGDTTKTVPPGSPVTITVSQPAATSPAVTITLRGRHGHATPHLNGYVHTGGGNVDVQQPSSDTFVITMTGVAVAYCGPHGASASMTFDLEQCFEVVFENTKVKKAKLTMEARVIGLLRSHCKGGSAAFTDACATVSAGPAAIATLCLEPHSVAGGENLSVNDHDGPLSVAIGAGKHDYHQRFTVTACAPKCLLPCKAPSAEFAPDPALNPLWISASEPFRGATKKDFGFQVIVKVADDTGTEDEDKKDEKKDDKK